MTGSRQCLLLSEQNVLCDLGEVTEALWLYCPSADGGGGC